MTASTSLESVPQEVLEHIAFYAATQNPVGPPSGLLPILLSCRDVYQALSLEANPYLYARIFDYEFDTDSAFRRLGPHINVPRVLADELNKRWALLKRVRPRASSQIRQAASFPSALYPPLIDSLWLALLMMLENDGKNERQLLEYVELDVWLMVYLFDADGASLAAFSVLGDKWPVEDEKNTIATWLFWFLLRPDVILQHVPSFPQMMPIMRLTTLAAHRYPICQPAWTAFLPTSDPMTSPRLVTHFSETYRMTPPPFAPAAILSFLTLAFQMSTSGQRGNHIDRNTLQSLTNLSSAVRRSGDWDAYWHRCISLGQPNHPRSLSRAYGLGSIEGIWEGIFAYTEFDVYWELLTGDVPSTLDQCLFAHHPQTWKLREYYLTEHPQEHATEESQPLGPGHPLNSHFAPGTRFQELSDSVQVHPPDGDAVRYWRRLPHATSDDHHKVVDVIILGEGHSAWGQFNLYGRVRPLDGLISLSKAYVEGNRGKWLYRGYLVGDTDGHISGRWRDSLSPANVPGYEGCFAMSRRK